MKRLLLAALLALGLTTAAASRPAATCTGADDCRACKTCGYCKHCAQEGGRCGVCRRERATAAGSEGKRGD